MANTNFSGPLSLSGIQIIGSQQAAEINVPIPAAYTPTVAGAVAVVSANATDLGTTSAALKVLRDEVNTLTLTVNSLLAKLRVHGLIAP